MKRKALLIVVLFVSVSGRIRAEDPAFFTDPYLELAVESVLGADPSPSGMLELVYLNASSSQIFHLGRLEFTDIM